MIKKSIDMIDLKKIVGKADNGKFILSKMKISFNKSLNAAGVYSLIQKNYNYNSFKTIVRDFFEDTEKYKTGIKGLDDYQKSIAEWRELGLGEIQWPCSQSQFDNHTQSINNSSMTSEEKDKRISSDAIKFRRIKEMNTMRNDFIETIIFQKSDDIIPTIKHGRKGDFYIDGVKYDQKVAKSIGKENIARIKSGNWSLKELVEHPEEIIEWMYVNQDPDRFDADNRLYVIYLEPAEKITFSDVEKSIDESNFMNKTYKIEFTYEKGTKKGEYSTSAKVIFVKGYDE